MSQTAGDHRRFLRKQEARRMMPRGSYLPSITFEGVKGGSVSLTDWMAPKGGLLVMLSADCSVCPPALVELALFLKEHPSLDARLLMDAEVDEINQLLEHYDLDIPSARCSVEVMSKELTTSAVPWAYAINAAGQILAGDVFNSREHLLSTARVFLRL